MSGETGTVELACPHCDGAVWAVPAAVVDCPGCDRSFLAPSAAADPGVAAASRPNTHVSDVGVAFTGVVGLGATLVFYLTVVPALGDSYAAALFADRGWVPYAITLFAFWAIAILVLKTRMLLQQREDLEIDALPDAISETIDAARVPDFLPGLETLRSLRPDSLLVDRVELVLDLIRSGRGRTEVSEALAQRSQADADAVESSYTLVRVFIWAIPILGFIGTVLGIGSAVSGFSQSVAAAVDLDVMKQSIGTVTSGLGVAFDTTLLALVVSIAIMLPASMLQKAEEDWLTELDARLTSGLLRRLAATKGPAQAAEVGTPLLRLADVVDRLDRSVAALDARLGTSGGHDDRN